MKQKREGFKGNQIVAGILAGLFGVLVVVDLLHAYLPKGQVITPYLWLAGWIGLAGLAIYALGELAFKLQFLSLLSLALMLGVFIGPLNSLGSLSGETTIEVNCGLRLWAQTAQGLDELCLYGYPVRQYLIPALPTLLFGRSHMALNVGAVIYVFIGVTLLVWGLHHIFRYHIFKDVLAAMVPLLLLHSYHFLRVGYFYEQSLYPVTFAMMVTGLGLWLSQRKDQLLQIWLAWILLFCLYAYTPALPVFCLGLGGMIWWILRYRRKTKTIPWLSIGLTILLLIEFILALNHRRDIQLFSANRTGQDKAGLYAQDIKDITHHLFLQTKGDDYLTWVGWGVFMTTLIALSAGLLGRKGMIIAAWVWGFAYMVNLAKGYAMGDIDYRFHRVTTVFPVVYAAFPFLLVKWKVTQAIFIGWVVIALTGWIAVERHIAARQDHWHAIVYQQLSSIVAKPLSASSLTAAVQETDLPSQLYSLPDTFSYFMTHYEQVGVKKDCESARAAFQAQPSLILLSPELSGCVRDSEATYMRKTLVYRNDTAGAVAMWVRRDLVH